MLDDYKDILTVHDLCEIMPIGRNSIYNLLHTNRIKNIRVGKKIIIPKQAVKEFLETGC